MLSSKCFCILRDIRIPCNANIDIQYRIDRQHCEREHLQQRNVITACSVLHWCSVSVTHTITDTPPRSKIRALHSMSSSSQAKYLIAATSEHNSYKWKAYTFISRLDYKTSRKVLVALLLFRVIIAISMAVVSPFLKVKQYKVLLYYTKVLVKRKHTCNGTFTVFRDY